jgi:hypothetical protein
VPRLHAQGAHAVPSQRCISTAVVRLAPAVYRAIQLDRETCLRREEIADDVPKDDLTTEFDSELSAAEGVPQDALRWRGMAPRVLRAGREKRALMTKRGSLKVPEGG